jgi:hypothetical protein
MRLASGIVAALGACALAGCGASDRDQVKSKVQQLASAAAKHDYTVICEQVLAHSLISRLEGAGVGCEQAMQVAFGSVQDPTLAIGKITVSGDAAHVATLTGAKGQTPSLDTIDLVKTSDGWRISSLAAPIAPNQ